MSPPRVPPVEPAALDPAIRPLIDGTIKRYGRRLNLFATFARHPRLFERWFAFALHSERSTLPARSRELLILRTAFRCHSDYEWTHHIAIGREHGVTDREIVALQAEVLDGTWSPADRTLLQTVDHLCASHDLPDAAWLALAATQSEPEIMDIVFTVGLYVQIAIAANALRVQLEECPEQP